ncbi:MAG TPA: ABC transporter permease [Longimicrobiales bacterium]|nr:ABC transporter permease [Longimicrobiales bacterium]
MSKLRIPLMRIESLKEGVHLALDQLRANKFRSALTIIGIVVGVASVMAMSAMVTGIRSGIMSDLEAAGPKNFFFSRYDWNEVRIVSDDGPPWGSNPEVTVAEVLALRRLPAIKDAIPGVDGSVVMEFGRERIANVQVPGRGSGWTNYTGGRMIAGHDFLPNDVLSAAPVTVVSSELAAKLFGPLDPVNRMVRMNGQAFRVIGVFEPAPNIFASIMKHFAIVPYTAALKHLNFDDEMIVGLIVTAPNATQDEAMDQVAAYVRTSRGVHPSEDNNFALIRQEEMARTFNKITGIFFMIMIALSSVALMVGGVGVIAIMMIAVTERTREIGIRKALGATQREILWQFLFESVTVTFIGGVIGMIIGGSLAFIVAALTPIDAQVPIGGIIAALGMATVAGVLFGLWPAWRAARLDPVVALRYE